MRDACDGAGPLATIIVAIFQQGITDRQDQEPIVLLLNGTLLIGVAIYALITAVANILEGGNELRFDLAIIYAAITVAICTVMAWFEVEPTATSSLISSLSMCGPGSCRAALRSPSYCVRCRICGERNPIWVDRSLSGSGCLGTRLCCHHPATHIHSASGAVGYPFNRPG